MVTDAGGVLSAPGDATALAAAVTAAARLDRRRVRRHAEHTCSVERMVDEYERCYRAAIGRDLAA